jgi:hypothetical protein
MNRRIAVVSAVLLVLIAAVIAQVALAGGSGARAGANGERLSGPWYSPQERQALVEYAIASFAQKRAILAGAGTP